MSSQDERGVGTGSGHREHNSDEFIAAIAAVQSLFKLETLRLLFANNDPDHRLSADAAVAIADAVAHQPLGLLVVRGTTEEAAAILRERLASVSVVNVC